MTRGARDEDCYCCCCCSCSSNNDSNSRDRSKDLPKSVYREYRVYPEGGMGVELNGYDSDIAEMCSIRMEETDSGGPRADSPQCSCCCCCCQTKQNDQPQSQSKTASPDAEFFKRIKRKSKAMEKLLNECICEASDVDESLFDFDEMREKMKDERYDRRESLDNHRGRDRQRGELSNSDHLTSDHRNNSRTERPREGCSCSPAECDSCPCWYRREEDRSGERCERCWRFESPKRTPVNKPDQRYNPNFRRAHGCPCHKGEDYESDTEEAYDGSQQFGRGGKRPSRSLHKSPTTERRLTKSLTGERSTSRRRSSGDRQQSVGRQPSAARKQSSGRVASPARQQTSPSRGAVKNPQRNSSGQRGWQQQEAQSQPGVECCCCCTLKTCNEHDSGVLRKEKSSSHDRSQQSNDRSSKGDNCTVCFDYCRQKMRRKYAVSEDRGSRSPLNAPSKGGKTAPRGESTRRPQSATRRPPPQAQEKNRPSMPVTTSRSLSPRQIQMFYTWQDDLNRQGRKGVGRVAFCNSPRGKGGHRGPYLTRSDSMALRQQQSRSPAARHR